MRAFALIGVGARGINIVAELGGNRELVTVRCAKGFNKNRFSPAVVVGVGGIVKGDTQFAGAAQKGDALLPVGDAPPRRRHRPYAKAYGARFYIGSGKSAVLHDGFSIAAKRPRHKNKTRLAIKAKRVWDAEEGS